MKLDVEARIPFSRELVFRTYRDQLVELVPYLPNIRGIERRSRDDDGPRSKIVNLWRGGGEIPAVARAVISEKMLSWTDHAAWDGSDWSCHWRMEAHSFTEAVHAEGDNRFFEDGGGCLLRITGDLTIDARKLPLPRFLAGTVGPAVEKFLAGMIKPNLTEVSKGVERYLAAHEQA
jgi:hypothetical protein